MLHWPNERSGVDAGTALSWHIRRLRPGATHRERWPKRFMRSFILLFAVLVGLVGCQSSPPSKPVSFDPLNEKAIYAALKSEPVPLPQTTPYDGDTRQREAFNAGFRSAWHCAISGALLHGTFGTPTDLADDLREAWSAGWKSGAKIGGDRWLAESKRQKETPGQPDGSANRSQPFGLETNRTPPAAGSGG